MIATTSMTLAARKTRAAGPAGKPIICDRSLLVHSRGFTLIELLVVVAVIAVLLAILMPALSRARALGKRVACGGNLRQLAVAWNNYLTDNNGRFYQGINANISYGGWKGLRGWWPRPLNRYALGAAVDANDRQGARLFHCPADRGGVPGGSLRELVYDLHGTSYQTNIFLIGQDSCTPFSERTAELDVAIAAQLPGLNINRVASHTRLLLIGDYGWINQWKPRPHPQVEWKELAEWHGKADCHNMAFLDGHVAFTKIQKGFYVTSEYCVLPFQSLYGLAEQVQGPAQ
jgi:prepilin-type N-terminal cleavage/methylation domain-containing protein/prepilin-type processing-associated H-X9-DG protein